MDNTPITVLSLLRIFLPVLGALLAGWGVYDMFGDGQTNSTGIKKIIGGAAFMGITYFLMTWAINQVTTSMSMIGG